MFVKDVTQRCERGVESVKWIWGNVMDKRRVKNPPPFQFTSSFSIQPDPSSKVDVLSPENFVKDKYRGLASVKAFRPFTERVVFEVEETSFKNHIQEAFERYFKESCLLERQTKSSCGLLRHREGLLPAEWNHLWDVLFGKILENDPLPSQTSADPADGSCYVYRENMDFVAQWFEGAAQIIQCERQLWDRPAWAPTLLLPFHFDKENDVEPWLGHNPAGACAEPLLHTEPAGTFVVRMSHTLVRQVAVRYSIGLSCLTLTH
jgi:hypothetical protein